MSRSRQCNYYLWIDTKVYTAKVLIFCLWGLIDFKKIIMTYAEVRERSCNKNLESYIFPFLPLHTLENLFCLSFSVHTNQAKTNAEMWVEILWRNISTFLSLTLDMLDLNSIQFHSGIKEKNNVIQNDLWEERSNLGFSLTS